MKYLPLVFCLASLFWTSVGTAALPRLQDIEGAVIAKDFSQAQAMAEDLLRRDLPRGEREEVQYYLALSRLYQAQYDEAGTLFQDLETSAQDPRLREKAALGRVDVLLLSGDYESAIQAAQAMLQRDPQSSFLSLIHLKIARAHLKLAHWEQARDQLNMIRKRFPGSLEAYTAQRLLEEKQYFSVQVGAFLSRERAEKQAEDLNEKGHYAYVVETVDKDGQRFYRVRVGQFSVVDEALRQERRLSQQGYPTLIYP